MDKVYAELIIAGKKMYADIPASIQPEVLLCLENMVEELRITREQLDEWLEK